MRVPQAEAMPWRLSVRAPRPIEPFLERRGVIERGPDPRLADDGFAEREPELAALVTAAVTGNPASVVARAAATPPAAFGRELPPLCLSSAPPKALGRVPSSRL
jgi:hypothetical protein